MQAMQHQAGMNYHGGKDNYQQHHHHMHHASMMNVQGMTDDDRRKRHRRTATEIARHYKCPLVGECHKSYGSEGSLNQHIKLKHPEFYAEQVA